MPHEEFREEIELPPRPFLYTQEQVAILLAVSMEHLVKRLAYFEGRSVHRRTPHDLMFFNISKLDERPVWRCPENELVRWMRRKGIKVRDSSWARH